MKIAYVNANYKRNHTGGGHVHTGQFIKNALELGHEVWVYPGNQYPGAQIIPTDRISHIKTMRKMDVLYLRLESRFVKECTWALPPRRLLYGFPVVVWEFNTIPEHRLTRGKTNQFVDQLIEFFMHYGRGCDLAICMTEDLAAYVHENFTIRRIGIIPNGSDPDQFHPDMIPVKRIIPFQEKLNVVWIGTGRENWHDIELMRSAATHIYNLDPYLQIAFHIIGPELIGIMADMPPNVFYWGAEYYRKVPQWLAGMDVGLSLYKTGPADYATPLKVFDYMASGLAVVSTPSPFMHQLFDQLGQTDLLIPSGDSQALADVLLKLSRNRERVKRLGMAGRQLVIDKYNWRRAVKDTMDEIEKILVDKKPRYQVQ